MGTTVEDQEHVKRIDYLSGTGAYIKFLSLEPLIGKISDLNLKDIDWVIVGGESGPGTRPMKEEWVISIKDECLRQNVPLFFKQWGGINKKKSGRLLQDKLWDEMP